LVVLKVGAVSGAHSLCACPKLLCLSGGFALPLIAGNESSAINRAVAFYRYLVGVPTTRAPQRRDEEQGLSNPIIFSHKYADS
jgi:hypothetical protein